MPETLNDRELAVLLERVDLAGAKLVPISNGAAYQSPTSLLSAIDGTGARLARLRYFLPDDEADAVPDEVSATGDPRIDLTEDAAIDRIAEEAVQSGLVVVATRADTVTRIAGAIRARRAACGEISNEKNVRLAGLVISPGDRMVVTLSLEPQDTTASRARHGAQRDLYSGGGRRAFRSCRCKARERDRPSASARSGSWLPGLCLRAAAALNHHQTGRTPRSPRRTAHSSASNELMVADTRTRIVVRQSTG